MKSKLEGALHLEQLNFIVVISECVYWLVVARNVMILFVPRTQRLPSTLVYSQVSIYVNLILGYKEFHYVVYDNLLK